MTSPRSGENRFAHGINNRGQVVGDSAISSGPDHAFVWSAKERMQDLNDLIPVELGIVLEGASAINDRGQIAADGGGRAYLLTPASLDENPAPGVADEGSTE